MWSWLLSVAWGGGVYINDILVDPTSLAGTSLERVTVAFDEEGNLRIEAPGYKVEVIDPPAAPQPTPPTNPNQVPPAQFWLVSEDNGSTGHTVECMINGEKAVELRSGEPQRILDVGKWLRPGANKILMKSMSRSATGGSFYVYVGTGRADETGTVVMDDPAVQFGLGASRQGEYQREFTLMVDSPGP